MSVRRLACSAALFAAVSGGCAASRVGHLMRPEALSQRPDLPSPVVTEFVAKHNQNAEVVTSVQASPTVSGKFGMTSGGTKSRMAFERPHNFRFVVETGFAGKKQADIGSNDEQFWFWANDKNDLDVHVCRYDAVSNPASHLELPFQPDWIVEALGLREIPSDEARAIKVTNGPKANTLTWTHYRKTLSGEDVKKVTIVDRTTGQILQHQFFLPRMKTPIAYASPTAMKTVPLASDPSQSVTLPSAIHMSLAPADPRASAIEMDLALNQLRVNAPISEETRTALFTVPPPPDGSKISYMDEPANGAPRGGGNRRRTEMRNSAPAPEAGGAELREPVPLGVDDAYLKRSDPRPLEPDLGGNEEVVSMPMPSAPENPAEKLSRRDRNGYPQ